MNIQLKRTNSTDADFQHLVNYLNDYLAIVDGEEHEFYSQFNHIDQLNHVVVAYVNNQPVACGAMKPSEPGSMEIKRMYTLESARGKGLAKRVLSALEEWAIESGYHTCILETGIRLPDAIALYEKMGYQRIDNYGQYINVENSRCFEKKLTNERV